MSWRNIWNTQQNLTKLLFFSVLSSKSARAIASLIVRVQLSVDVALPSWYHCMHEISEILIAAAQFLHAEIKATKASTKTINYHRDSLLQSRGMPGARLLADNLNHWHTCFAHILAAACAMQKMFHPQRVLLSTINFLLIFSYISIQHNSLNSLCFFWLQCWFSSHGCN